MGNSFTTFIRSMRNTPDRPEIEIQQQTDVQTQIETNILSSTDIDPLGLRHFDCELNIRLENPLSIRIRFYSFPDLLLDSNSLCRFLDHFAMRLNHSHLRAMAQESDNQLAFFMVTYEHLQHSELTDFVVATNARGLILVSTDEDESNRNGHQSLEDLPDGIVETQIEVETPGGLVFTFRIFRLNDGVISTLEVRRIVLEELMQPDNFSVFEDAMQQNGEIDFFVGTHYHLSNTVVIDFLQRIRGLHMNMRIFLYEDQVSETHTISDEEASDILGSAAFWSQASNDIEIDCAICLESFQRGDKVKTLLCNHVYHYKCILRSTKMKRKCPICRASYDCRQG